jgi:hypothetical protein
VIRASCEYRQLCGSNSCDAHIMLNATAFSVVTSSYTGEKQFRSDSYHSDIADQLGLPYKVLGLVVPIEYECVS